VPERIFECALLGRDLRADVQVLHLAAAAESEVRAARHHALRAVAPPHRRGRLLPVVLAPVHVDLHLLPRQRVLDEDDLALAVVGDALRLEVERLDLQPFIGLRHGLRLFMPLAASRRSTRATLFAVRRELPCEAAEGAGPVATRDRTLRQKD
jgi:hypothetical protein